jgi:hypothetical protein
VVFILRVPVFYLATNCEFPVWSMTPDPGTI